MGQEEGQFQIYLCETLGKAVNKERNRMGPLAVDSVKVSPCTRPTAQTCPEISVDMLVPLQPEIVISRLSKHERNRVSWSVAWKPMHEFVWNLIFSIFTKICQAPLFCS